MVKVTTRRVGKERALRGWSQLDLSQKSGVNRSTVCMMEKGNPVRPETAKRIADTLGMTVADLFEITDVREGKEV